MHWYYTVFNSTQLGTSHGICFIFHEFVCDIYDEPSSRYESISRFSKGEQGLGDWLTWHECFGFSDNIARWSNEWFSNPGCAIDEEGSVAIIIVYEPFGLINFILADEIP